MTTRAIADSISGIATDGGGQVASFPLQPSCFTSIAIKYGTQGSPLQLPFQTIAVGDTWVANAKDAAPGGGSAGYVFPAHVELEGLLGPSIQVSI
jgi:hypothetical protein